MNWILLDEQFSYVVSNSGFEQVGAMQAYSTHSKADMPIDKNGYLYIYVSNETPNIDVFFDNLQVTHIRGPLIEETAYYPFGLTVSGISSKALAFGQPENKKKYQNYEFNSDFDLNLYESFYRTHDPQLGRFLQIDPKPTHLESLYAAMGNNPMKNIDILGDTLVILMENDSWDISWGNAFVKNPVNDGVYIVIGHGNPRVIQYENDKGEKINATTGQQVLGVMQKKSPEFKKSLEKDKVSEILLISCNTGSKEATNKNSDKKITIENPIAKQISEKLPKANIIAPNGLIAIGFKNGKAIIAGVENDKKNGGLVTFKTGKEVPSKFRPMNFDSAGN